MKKKKATFLFNGVPQKRLIKIANSYHPVGCFRLLCDVFGETFTTKKCVGWLRRFTLDADDKVKGVLRTISEQERTIIEHRYGLNHSQSIHGTLQSLGNVFALTRERIRQLEERALKKMRHPTRIRQLKTVWAS